MSRDWKKPFVGAFKETLMSKTSGVSCHQVLYSRCMLCGSNDKQWANMYLMWTSKFLTLKRGSSVTNVTFLKCTKRDYSLQTSLKSPWVDHLSILAHSHLDTGHGVPVSMSYLCSAPSAVHSRSHSSARPSHTLAFLASEGRWPHSDCPCLQSATATENTATCQWVKMVQNMRQFNSNHFRFYITRLIPFNIIEFLSFLVSFLDKLVCSFFLADFLSFFLVFLCLNKGCIQLNLRLCQTNVQIGLMGHLPILLKTFLRSSNTCRLLPFFV